MAIFRLAPADFHRMHSPANVKVSDVISVYSSYYSVRLFFVFSFIQVNAEALRAEDDAIYNTRKIIILNSLNDISNSSSINPNRPMAFVALGATCVGSVILSVNVESVVKKGDELAWFEFGGSTIVMLFPPNSVQFDDDLIQASANTAEVKTLIRQSIGKWIN